MKITEEYLESIRSPQGGYTREILAKLGIAWPPKKGWRSKLIGKELSELPKIAKITNRPPLAKTSPFYVKKAPNYCPNCGHCLNN